jgi:hypothetical protein
MKSFVGRLYLSFFLIAISVILPACSGGGGGASSAGLPSDEYEAVLLSTTKPLSAETLANLAEVSEDGTFRFIGSGGEAANVAANDVIIGGPSDKTPFGFIRFVTSVGTSTQGDLVLSTIPAPIQAAFQKLHVKFTRSIPDIGAAATGRPASPLRFSKFSGGAGSSLTVDYFPFNGDKDPLTVDDQVHVTGTLSGGLEYTFGIDVDWGDVVNIPAKIAECAQQALLNPLSVCDPIPKATVNLSVSGSVKADLSTKGVSFLPYTKDVPVYGPVPLTPFSIGPILWFFPEFEISSKIEGAASSQFATGLSMEADAGVGVSISNKETVPHFNPAPFATVTTTAPTVDATLDAYSKVRLGPQISIRLLDFAGPRAGLFGFAELKASQDNVAQGKPCYSLNSGVEGELGFEIGVDFGIKTVTLAKWDLTQTLFTHEESNGACTGGSNVVANPLQNPTFTPWSDAYSNMVTTTGMPFSAPGGSIAGTVLEQTIDGNFVIAGSGSKGLLKIDGQGNTVWAKRFVGPLLGDAFITELLPDHVAPSQDAAMLVSAYPWALLKVDAGGDLVWAKQFAFAPKSDVWRVSDITADGSGGVYLIASYSTGTIPLDVDTLAARLDGAGQVLWLRRIGDASVSEVPRVVIPFHGGIVVAGSKCTLNASGLCGFKTLWAVNLDSSGTVSWSREYPLAVSSSVYPLTGHEAVDGDLIIGGTIEASPQRSFLAKIKPDGSIGFLTAYRKINPLGLEDFSLTSLVPLPQTGYIAAGAYLPYPGTLGKDLWVASLDGIGAVQWAKRMKSPDGSEELMPAITYTSDGGAFVTGYTQTLAGGTGFWSLKTFAKDGTITFTPASGVIVEDITASITNDTALFCGTATTCTGLGTGWNPLVQDFAASLGAVQVTVVDLPVAVTRQSP